MNQLFVEVTVHLVTQPGHQHVDDIGQRIEVVCPDVLDNHGLKYHSADVAHQILQQRKLAGLQIGKSSGANNLTPKQRLRTDSGCAQQLAKAVVQASAAHSAVCISCAASQPK